MAVDVIVRFLKQVALVALAVTLAACSSGNNRASMADAGSDQSVGEGALVTLDGGGSTGKGALTYAWTQTAGTPVTLSDATAVNPTFTAPIVAVDELLTFQLEVTDAKSRTDADSVGITIVSNGPTADAGPDQSVVEQTAVALDGTGSSQMTGGVIVSYAWMQTAGSPVTLSDATATSPTFTAPTVAADETITFELTVTDDDGDSDTDTVDVTVLDDTAPVADAGADQTVNEGDAPVTLDGSGSSDAVGTIVSFAWLQTAGPAVVLTGASTDTATFTAPQIVADTVLTFELTVADDSGQMGVDVVDVTVQNVNQLPAANAGPDQMVGEGVNVNLDGSASADADGVIATHAWTQTSGPTVVLTGANTATPSFTAPLVMAATTMTFELTVVDNDGGQGTDTVDISINVFNLPPTANAGPDQGVDEQTGVNLNGSGSSDPDGAIATYVWVQTAGAVVALNNAGTATPDFTSPVVVGAAEVLSFQLTVTDNDVTNPKIAMDAVDITVSAVNADPVANAGVDQVVLELSAVNLDGTTSNDADGSIDTYLWTQTVGTNVVLAGANTATPSFTAPPVAAAGEVLTFRLDVTDNEGATVTDMVDIQVDNDPSLSDPPTAVAGPDQTVAAAVVVTLDGSASTDTDGTIVTYAWTQTAGPVVALTNADQAIATFTAPAAPAALTFQLEVTDNEAATGIDTVDITVNAPPTANAGIDQTVLEQTAVTLDGSGSSDPEGPIATFSWMQTAGTAVALNNAATAAPDFIAPSVDVAGETLSFELTVTDSDGVMATDTVDIQVDNDAALNVLPTAAAGPDQAVAEGAVVTLDGSASSDDGAITDYLWTQTAGAGVVINNAGQAVATFTSPAGPDTLTFQLEVTDDEGGMASDSVDVSVSSQVTVSGTVQFEEVPFGAGGFGLDYSGIVAMPARLVVVEIIDVADGVTVLATTVTDANGDYSVDLDSNIDVFVRVRAEMIQTGGPPSWDVKVVDNTNMNALYTMRGSDFNTGMADRPNEDLLATTGWDGASYSGPRVAAPFAVLDAVHIALQFVLSADATAAFPPLLMHWSPNNRPVPGDVALGEIGTANYSPADGGIFLRGEADNQTDEYDEHVIIHEWGHYFEDQFSRSDSIGGSHTIPDDQLDMRVAFGEGFADAFSAMASGSALVVDTAGLGQAFSAIFNVETGPPVNAAPGWYSEQSVFSILYDLFDAPGFDDDPLGLGFGPIYSVFVNQQASTTAATSIFSFIRYLKDDLPADAADIDSIVATQSISTVADIFGTGEMNSGTPPDADILPVYKSLIVNGPAVNVCSTTTFDPGEDGNKLGVIQAIRFTLTVGGTISYNATATVIPAGETTDPDILLRQPPSQGIFEVLESVVANAESTKIFNNNLSPGDYILEVFDFNNRRGGKLLTAVPPSAAAIGRACFDVTVTQP